MVKTAIFEEKYTKNSSFYIANVYIIMYTKDNFVIKKRKVYYEKKVIKGICGLFSGDGRCYYEPAPECICSKNGTANSRGCGTGYCVRK